MKKKKGHLKRRYYIIWVIIKYICKLGIVALAIILIQDRISANRYQSRINEENVMNAYIDCLQNNFTQRDYCSKKVSDSSYLVLDQKLERYGYRYEQRGYDLYLVEISK